MNRVGLASDSPMNASPRSILPYVFNAAIARIFFVLASRNAFGHNTPKRRSLRREITRWGARSTG